MSWLYIVCDQYYRWILWIIRGRAIALVLLWMHSIVALTNYNGVTYTTDTQTKLLPVADQYAADVNGELAAGCRCNIGNSIVCEKVSRMMAVQREYLDAAAESSLSVVYWLEPLLGRPLVSEEHN
mmetsp:Transcript_32584/g.68507  ORF Transcript_32584/g.68507 Transcript_32584/m.68507 type:complete len:125 (+) Transcript_32584:425-799(+)